MEKLMYLNTTVKIPVVKGKIITKKKGGATYILYQYGSEYNSEKQYAVPQRAIVGKVSDADPALMFPNEKFQIYFPDVELSDELPYAYRSCCLRIGSYVIIQKVLDECMPKRAPGTSYGDAKVFRAPGQVAEGYTFYRVGSSDETKRAIDEIPPEELANGMHEILIDFNSCEKDVLFRETVKLFGLSAVTAKARKFLEYGFAVLQKRNRS
jgi:hypothetical protein